MRMSHSILTTIGYNSTIVDELVPTQITNAIQNVQIFVLFVSFFCLSQGEATNVGDT